MTFQDEMLQDIIKIKSLAEQAEQTMRRSESKTKYQLLLDELTEITECIGDLRQRAQIAYHFIKEEGAQK